MNDQTLQQQVLGKSLLYLSRAEVEALDIAPLALIDAVDGLFAAKANGKAQSPPKLGIYPGGGKLFQTLVAASDAFAATKTIGLAPKNPEIGLPTIGSLITLLDGPTGAPVAVMDGTWITAMRTAAMSAAAARRLARRDSRRIGFVACGAQGLSHLILFQALFPQLKAVTAYSRRKETAEVFAGEARKRGLQAAVVTDPRDAVRGQDIVITSVPEGIGELPTLDAGEVEAGGFVSMVDLGRSWRSDTLARFDLIATDDKVQCEYVRKSGRITFGGAIPADLGDLATAAHPGRTSDRQRIAFLFPGFALGDLAGAILVYQHARAAGRGMVLPL